MRRDGLLSRRTAGESIGSAASLRVAVAGSALGSARREHCERGPALRFGLQRVTALVRIHETVAFGDLVSFEDVSQRRVISVIDSLLYGCLW